jgi:hypothetical protein
MNKHNIYSLNAARELKRAEDEDFAYQAKILTMDKLELLNEMVRFQEERTQAGALDLPMIIRGRILFQALEKTAETEALASLTKSYRRHLDLELKEFMKKRPAQ